MKIRIIDISAVEGFRIGNAENTESGTGCTVIICEKGAAGGVDVRGGGPATRETDLLKSENTVDAVNAVVLSGGSAFGLEAASGVMKELRDRGLGFDTGYGRVPIVCGASLFDLGVGDPNTYPDIDMGIQAVKNAYDGIFDHGNKGAGTGASVGKVLGMDRAMKTGLGTFACGDEYLQVGAITAVNAMGDIYNGAGNIIAGLRTEDGNSIYGSIKSLKPMVHKLTDEKAYEENDQEERIAFNELNLGNKAAIASAIRNAFSSNNKSTDMMVTGQISKADLEAARSEGALEKASDIQTLPEGSTSNEAETDTALSETDIVLNQKNDSNESVFNEPVFDEAIETEEIKDAMDDADMGYDIPFNTTISCLITNAKMTKSQCNKLASILHDAYARAIKPVHGTLDGDTVFVMTTGTTEINFDAFAALATDVLQYAIIDAATSSEGAYGLPAARDLIRK